MTTLAPALYTRTFPRVAGWLRDLTLITLQPPAGCILRVIFNTREKILTPLQVSVFILTPSCHKSVICSER
jgi:hypothetical protein